MDVNEALKIVKAAGYRVSKPKPKALPRRPLLNALGKPYGANYDPNYKMSYRAGSTAHLLRPYSEWFRQHLTKWG